MPIEQPTANMQIQIAHASLEIPIKSYKSKNTITRISKIHGIIGIKFSKCIGRPPCKFSL